MLTDIIKKESDLDKVVSLVQEMFLIPEAKKAFNNFTAIKSVVIGVAQYWNDEADDQVHLKFFGSTYANPSWDQLFDFSINKFAKLTDSFFDEEENSGSSYTFHPENNYQLWDLSYEENFTRAFERFCHDANQEQDYRESYSPLITITKEGNEFTVTEHYKKNHV